MPGHRQGCQLVLPLLSIPQATQPVTPRTGARAGVDRIGVQLAELRSDYSRAGEGRRTDCETQLPDRSTDVAGKGAEVPR